MTLKQAIEYSGVSYSTLRRKIELGVLPAYKPGKAVLIDQKDLELFIRKSRKKTA
jgi:excisionase family DNA binding protein